MKKDIKKETNTDLNAAAGTTAPVKDTAEKKRSAGLWVRLIAFALAALLPFGVLAAALFLLPDAYSETFLGELAAKYALLKDRSSPDKQRIVLVGGSSVAFGVDSDLLASGTGCDVVNFGLYADLGTKLMLDLSRDFVGENDLVVLAPELDAQTLSMFFKAESAWQALGGNLEMLKHVGSDNYSQLAGGIIKYVGSQFKYALSGTKLSPTGIYRRDSFNALGDVVYARPKNVMTAGFDINQSITLTPDIFDPEFLDYLNDYIADVTARGAEVCFSFCPMNRSAFASGSPDGPTEEELKSVGEFYRFVCEHVNCPVIGSPEESLMDEGYFYDTNYHLNDAGVIVHTAALIEDVLRYRGVVAQLAFAVPDVPGREQGGDDTPGTDDPGTDPGTEPVEESEWEKYFVYADFGKALAIVGTTDAAKSLKSVEIPTSHSGREILILRRGAFTGCTALEELIIRENLTLIEDGALSGASSLKTVQMRREESENLEVGEGFLEGAPDNVVILLYSETSYANFSTGYWWALYSGKMEMAK